MNRVCGLMGVVAFILFASAGCMEVSQCEVRALEGGGSEISCPRGESILSDEKLPDDAKCQLRDSEIICTSGERFDVGGDRVDGDLPGAGIGGEDLDGEDLDGPNGPSEGFDSDNPQNGSDDGGQGSSGGFGSGMEGAGAWESECTVLDGEARCFDGATGYVGEGESDCVSRMIPGRGRRIVCDDGDEVRPDDDSVSGVEVSCEKKETSEGEGVILCSDGTGALLEEGEVFEEDCELESERVGNEVVVSCGASQWIFPLSNQCMGTFYIEDAADLQRFWDRGCERWWGDLVVRDSSIEELHYMLNLKFINGTLEISENSKLTEFGFPNLLFVGGDLFVRGNPKLKIIGGWKQLLYVSGMVDFSNNVKVHSIEARPKHFVGGAWSISNNPELTFIGMPRKGSSARFFILPDVDIEGVFLFFDNIKWGACREQVVWRWATERAEAVYIGNSGGWLNGEAWCERFVNLL